MKTPIKFYEGINRDTGNICYGGCICSIKGVLGTAEKRFPGTLAHSKKGAIVMGHYKGDVVHPGEPVALIGTCAGVEGKFEAGKVYHIKGCPPKVAQLAITLLHKFDIKSPAFEPSNIAKIAYHSVVEQSMKMLIPFSKGIIPRANRPPETSSEKDGSCESGYDEREETA